MPTPVYKKQELEAMVAEARSILTIGKYAFSRLEGTSNEADRLYDRVRAFLHKTKGIQTCPR